MREEFDRVWPWLEAALACNPIVTHDKEDVWTMLAQDVAHLFTTPNAALLTEVKLYPKAKVLHGWLAGGDMKELQLLASGIEQWCAERGFDGTTIDGREGWERVLDGYRRTAVKLTKDLRA